MVYQQTKTYFKTVKSNNYKIIENLFYLPGVAAPHVSHQNENVVADFQMHEHPEIREFV